MTELSHESLSNIAYLVQDQNYFNIKARLDLKLPGEDSKLFSPIDITGNSASWIGEDNINYKTYSEANEIEKEEIAAYMEEVRDRAQEILGEQMPYIQDLFHIPSQKQIFWYRNEEGDLRVTLTQWGFKPATQDKQTDIIDMLINLPRKHTQSEVTIHIDFSDGTVASLEDFEFTLFGNTSPRRTDEKGNYFAGKLHKGKAFFVKSQHNEVFDFTVDNSCSVYPCVFALYTDYDITVVNQENTAKPGYRLTINGEERTCDQDGKVSVKELKLTPDNKQLKVVGENGQEEKVFTLDKEPELNKFTFQVKDTFTANLDVIVKYDDGEVLPQYDVEIDINGKTRECKTDDNGKIRLSNLEEDMKVSVSDIKTATKAESNVKRGENICELIINKEKPVKKIVKIQILGYKKELLDGVKVTITTPKGEYIRTSDGQGCIELPFECFEDKKKNKISFHLTRDYIEGLKNKPRKK